MSLILRSPAFEHEGEIPRKYTCDGADVSPPLEWAGVPAEARSLALIVEDPDAPDPAAPQTIWVHWILYNLPPDSRGLPEAVPLAALPPGTLEGLNDWNRPGYGGPCPPIGRHRYFFRLFALSEVLPDLDFPRKDDLEQTMAPYLIELAELMGTYQR